MMSRLQTLRWKSACQLQRKKQILWVGNDEGHPEMERELDLNLSYTINLVLPKTDDPAVFNAIFRSLREYSFRISRRIDYMQYLYPGRALVRPNRKLP
jgi:hypothetical protein